MLNARWWLQVFAATIFTMIMIYIVKQIVTRYNVPVLKDVAAGI